MDEGVNDCWVILSLSLYESLYFMSIFSYDYMRLMISELQRQLAELDSNSSQSDEHDEQSISRPPRRQNPFNKGLPQTSHQQPQVPLRPAPPPPIIRDTMAFPIKDDNEFMIFSSNSTQNDKDDFTFITVHEYFGKAWNEIIKSRQEAKEKIEQPLIVL